MPYTPPLSSEVDFDGPAGAAYAPPPVAVSFPPVAADPYTVSLGLSVRVAEVYAAALPLDVSVADARVFDAGIGAVSWSLQVLVGGVDLSSRLTGQCTIEAEEDAARVATLSLIPASAAQLEALESATVTIDAIVSGGGYSARRRRFTGHVERVEFAAASRVATLTCRDGYQERIKACASAADVLALMDGAATVSYALAVWDEAEPDPWGYFSDLLNTVPGATFVDGAGNWQVARWNIGTPQVSYGAGDLFDHGPVLERTSRADTPSAIVATLTHTFPRLHNAQFSLSWSGLPGLEYTTRGISAPTLPMLTQALEGLGDWHIAGKPTFTNFDPVNWPVGLSMTAAIYRRWYQMVARKYTVTIPMGGDSDRDESVSFALQADFDAAQWESGKSGATTLSVYLANPPTGTPTDPGTGYEELVEPWPPANSAMDHFAAAEAEVTQAIAHMVAAATRTAAQGRRRQRVTVSRPVDLRLEIGAVVAVDAYGVAATGQVQSWGESYDFDLGGCVGDYVLACPEGNDTVTASSVSVTYPALDVEHGLTMAGLSNWIGASNTTPTSYFDTDSICGHLANVALAAAEYDADAPMYQEQFRIVAPEIPEALRDPVDETVDITASISIAGAGASVTF